jgi:CheY-like chemotaxis protein
VPGRRKILIVDDEDRILRSTQMLLDVLGYDAVTLKDSAHMVEVAARERPDLIFQDLKMPRTDVEGLVRDLKANPQTADIPYVFFSASPNLPETAARLDAAGYLAKPFREGELLELLERSLDAHARPEGAT